jgi:hypothetical protein
MEEVRGLFQKTDEMQLLQEGREWAEGRGWAGENAALNKLSKMRW